MASVISNSRGQALIQMMIAAAIGAIIMTAIASIQNNQTRENRSMTEKLAANDFQNQMLRSLLDGTVCTSLLTGKTFDSSNAVPGNPNQPSILITQSSIPVATAPNAPALAKAGDPVSSVSTTLKIDAEANNPFRIVEIVGSSSGGIGTFTGSFQINFDQTQLIRPIKSASTKVILKTTSSGTTQTVTGCTTMLDNTCWVSGPNGLTTINCGNVGIGTTTPGARLHVMDSLFIDSRGGLPSGPSLTLFGTSDDWIFNNSYPNGNRLDIGHQPHATGVTNPFITVLPNSHVGVGTTNPKSPLQVNGYLQIINNSISPPPASDCQSPDHMGRMIIYTPAVNVHRICFCPQNIGGGPIRWWCTPDAVPVP